MEEINLSNLLASFVMFGNEACSRECAAMIERYSAPIISSPDLANLIRSEANVSLRMVQGYRCAVSIARMKTGLGGLGLWGHVVDSYGLNWF